MATSFEITFEAQENMFTGLVETIGQVSDLEKQDGYTVISIGLHEDAAHFGTTLGESIAINGCCLTLTHFEAQVLKFDVSHESLAKTNLGLLTLGSHVNLERAMSLGERLGGHMVSGHIDTTALLERIVKQDGGWDVFVLLPEVLARYVIAKGSLTLDGVSLTVNAIEDTTSGCRVRLTLIPSTIEKTTFSKLKEGWKLNVEVDLIGKYIERMLAHR